MPTLIAASAGINWTALGAAAITGSTAILVGLFGLLGTRQTAAAARLQIQLETDRWTNERLDESRQRRAKAYEGLLLQERRLSGLTLTSEPITDARFRDWIDEWHQAFAQVVLHGTNDVRLAAGEMAEVFNEMWQKRVWGTPRDEFDQVFRAAYNEYVTRREAARGKLVETMRADTAASAVEEPQAAKS